MSQCVLPQHVNRLCQGDPQLVLSCLGISEEVYLQLSNTFQIWATTFECICPNVDVHPCAAPLFSSII